MNFLTCLTFYCIIFVKVDRNLKIESCGFMRIHWIEFENYTTGQKIEKIEFDRLNLLVGESGAGKTQILKTLSKYIDVVLYGKPIPFAGYFKMGFSVNQVMDGNYEELNKTFVWKIKTNESIINTNNSYSHGIVEEIVFKGNEKFITRDDKGLQIENQKAPEISPDKSVLNIFKEPIDISNIKANFFKTVSYFSQEKGLNPISLEVIRYVKKTLNNSSDNNMVGDFAKKLLFLPLNALIKVWIMKTYFKDTYFNFLNDLQAIFPVIEDVKVDFDNEINQYKLFILQDGMWIPTEEISSGMLKTIYILCNSNFGIDESVILLDELENGLGVNCLDEITDYICEKSYDSNTQFILTSHHPYIINQIPENSWRIISQQNGIISSKRAIEVGIDTSKNRQDKFFQYINYIKRAS